MQVHVLPLPFPFLGMSRNAYANMRLFLCFVLALMKTFEHNTVCTVYSVDDQSVARFHGTIKNLISLGC